MKKINESKLIQAADKFSGGGGEPPMSVFEVRLSNLEKDVAVIKSNYATASDVMGLKGDIKELRAGLQGDIKELRAGLQGDHQHLKGSLSAEIHQALNSQIKWLVLTMLAISSVAITVFKFL